MSGLRTRLSGLIPGAADIAFNRDRSRAMPQSRAPRGGYRVPVLRERETHVVVVPTEGPQFGNWRPGTWNFYYEAYQSAREVLGDRGVSVLDVSPAEPHEKWVQRLVDMVQDSHATHVITHVEHDPGSPDAWHWDVAWNRLAPSWDGVLLGVMFDSGFDLVSMKSRRIARMSPNFVAVDICMPNSGTLIRGRPEVGPVTMPVSRETRGLVQERLAGVSVEHDVSFMGALYPYRVELIEILRSHGVDVAVNPHREDATHDFASSRRDQPQWLDYMAGLAASKMTLNFSRSSAGNFEQLKTRVIEATLAGTFLLTDDRDRTRLYFEPEVEYGFFGSVAELPAVVDRWLSDDARRIAGARAAQVKAENIAVTDFWERIDRGLAARGLPVTGAG